MRNKYSVFVALSILLVQGCATNQLPLGVRDQPLPYQEGYRAGCDSGYVAAGHPYYRFNKDPGRFGSDTLYGQGWSDGFAVCKGSYESIGRAMR